MVLFVISILTEYSILHAIFVDIDGNEFIIKGCQEVKRKLARAAATKAALDADVAPFGDYQLCVA